jgi:hypothetical protein
LWLPIEMTVMERENARILAALCLLVEHGLPDRLADIASNRGRFRPSFPSPYPASASTSAIRASWGAELPSL